MTPTPADPGSPSVPPEATRFVLVRHGETDYNRDGRWQGSGVDVPLNQTGREQMVVVAERLAERYGRGGLAALYTSDLARASESAGILARRLRLEPRALPDLREMSHGEWEGWRKSEILARYAEEYHAFEADPLNVRRPGGDSYGDLAQRVWPAMEELAVRHRGERIVVVSHGGPIRLVLSRALGRPLTERHAFGVENAAWFEVQERAGRWSLLE